MLDKSPAVTASVNVKLPESKDEKSKEAPNPKVKKQNYYQCLNCKNFILGPNADILYTKHMKMCLGKNSCECTICFKKFSHKRGLKNHLRMTHLVFD